ncbi:29826_t:CDS:2, partial [Racocetra persica]
NFVNSTTFSICTEQEKNVKKIRSYLPPSSFALLGNLIKYHVKDKQLLIHHSPEYEKKHYQWTFEFINEMADIYPSELERSKKFKEKFQQLFGEELKIICLDDESSNDGILEYNFYSFSVLRLLAEIKNEIGTAGPWVCILGAVYIEKPIVDFLTDFIPLIPTNIRNHTERVAQLFKALCLGVNRLKEYYGSIANLQNSQQFFPYPNQYKRQNTTIEFTYEKKL